MSRVARVAAVLTIGFALAVGPAPLATASTADLDDFEIESFHTDYVLTRDSEGHAVLQARETIVAVYPDFDQNKGFYRDIPEYRHGVQLHTVVESVVDEFGIPVPYTTEYYQDFYSVGLGDDSYVHGRRTYVIEYTQVDVVEAFADTNADEFFWDVNGTGWAQPFGRTSMTLVVDAAIAPALTGDSACYTLTECSEPLTATPQADGSVLFTAAAESLRPNESLTFAIGFAIGTFEPGPVVVAPPSGDGNEYPDPAPEPTWWDQFGPFLLGPAGLVISWIAGGTQVSDRSRKTGPSDIIIPQYTPPEGLNVMVAAYLAGRPERAFAAQIVSLAVRKKVRLLDHPSDSTAPFEVELLDRTDLDDVERQVVDAVFGNVGEPGRRVPLGSTNFTLGNRLASVYRSVDKRLKSEGLQGPAKPTWLWGILCFLSVVVVAVAGFDTLRRFSDGFIAELGVIATIVAFVGATATFGRRSTVATLSAKGRDKNDYLLGMRDYMELAEEDRIRMLQSPEGAERVNVDDQAQLVKLYERLLPFAVIFGIEERWSEELSVRAVEANVPVTWWAGSSDFSSWRLNSTIQNLRRATPEPPRPVVAKVKSSSSGSGWGGWSSGGSSGGWSGSSGSSFSGGSSGGGFSGGGGGGGGGRGR
jgi:hypothetical protein